ncbi:kelch domain-containing protein 4-like [Argopecten irradians]|uniref:kelch domain-containing protein 4-like n=1 Tax=Argopecten irradians TaxID=31199 RepID=UPI003713F25B
MRMFIPCILVCILLTCTHGQLVWQQIANPALTPDPRRDAGLAFDATRNQLILFGGRPWTDNDTWIFDIGAGTWRSVNTGVQPASRFSFISGLQGDYFYVAMGEGLNRQFFDDIWRFSLVTETWEELPAQKRPSHLSASQWDESMGPRPEARYGAAGGIHFQGSNLFVNQGFSTQRYFDTYSYNVFNQSWSAEYCSGSTCNPYNPSYPHARCLHAGAMASPHELVIFGGCMSGGLTGGPCPSGDSWIYNSQTNDWTQLPSCPSPRVYGTMAMVPSSGGTRRLVLYGGKEELKQVLSTTVTEADEISVLDPDSMIWYRQKASYTTSPPAKRLSAAMATATTGVYMFGGVLQESGDTANDLWILSGTAADTESAVMLSCTKHFFNWILLHGIFMTIGWGGFLTWGALIARYFSGKGKLWFIFHVSFQVLGLIIAAIGIVFAILSVQSKHFTFAHGSIGIAVMILGLQQPLNACFRGKRPDVGETRSTRRKIWELIHHFSGRVAVLLALVNISLGVFFAVARTAVWALWYAYFAFLLVVVLIAEIVRGFNKDGRVQAQEPSTNETSTPGENYQVPAEPIESTNYTNPEFDSDLPVKM